MSLFAALFVGGECSVQVSRVRLAMTGQVILHGRSAMNGSRRRPNPSLHPNRYSGLRPLPRSGELKR
jgi:hypothetical protein